MIVVIVWKGEKFHPSNIFSKYSWMLSWNHWVWSRNTWYNALKSSLNLSQNMVLNPSNVWNDYLMRELNITNFTYRFSKWKLDKFLKSVASPRPREGQVNPVDDLLGRRRRGERGWCSGRQGIEGSGPDTRLERSGPLSEFDHSKNWLLTVGFY